MIEYLWSRRGQCDRFAQGVGRQLILQLGSGWPRTRSKRPSTGDGVEKALRVEELKLSVDIFSAEGVTWRFGQATPDSEC